MTDRNGWYVASTHTEHGDKEFSSEARLLWERMWADEMTGQMREEVAPGSRDGVSIFEQDGQVVRVLIRGENRTKLEPPIATAWMRLMEDGE